MDHGDDHFFPGAWDIAGAVVELELAAAAERALLDRYRRLTGDDAAPRLAPYLVAHAAQRVGALTLALLSADPAERQRLDRDLCRYRAQLARRRAAPRHRTRCPAGPFRMTQFSSEPGFLLRP